LKKAKKFSGDAASYPAGLLDVQSWETVPTQIPQTPQQDNCSDCGVFTCMFANYLSLGLELRFSAANMPNFRMKITLDTLNKKVEAPF